MNLWLGKEEPATAYLFMEPQWTEKYIGKPLVFLDFPVHLAKGHLDWMGFALNVLLG